jgi:hypothetical protein
MTRRILAAIHRALLDEPTDKVHFHTGSEGQAAVCYDQACSRPQLSV